MNQEDATKIIVKFLQGNRSSSGLSHHGYDVYIPNLIRLYCRENRVDQREEEKRVAELFPVFAASAWDLCRRGILRPGVSQFRSQSTDEGSAGAGFSVTPFGSAWLSERDSDIFVPTEPERFAAMLEPYKSHFGPGFHERAQQAIRCYGAHAYLACCAMCGAAAESILLAAAIAKTKDEPAVIKKYSRASGRNDVQDIVIGQADQHMKREFEGLSGLLKYWRDEAAHGKASNIAENEAYTSIAMLLRYAMYVDRNWNDLI
jgi:hypothetical protein